ncbi:MAG: carboxylesterase/lipase family protein [Corynebacterium sp.]|nr:carboxylesterase/lipase family protein [Corynebacterium sp.]
MRYPPSPQPSDSTSRPEPDDLIVSTIAGYVQGLKLTIPAPLRTWRGVPYGDSTAGEHRFRAPHPVTPWTGIKDCTEYGTIAAQPSLTPGDRIRGSEDCLNLDIVRPDDDRQLPVVVYFHGGSFIYGSSHQQVLRGHYLVEAMDVVYVSVNFRLGVFGYLDFSSCGDDCVPNPAVLDQLLALRWVKHNIAQFGGDPTNVTLMGESAGGASVITLMCTPAAHGLFHRAIAQSAPVAAVHSPAQAAFWCNELTTRAGLTNPTLNTLRELSPETLISAGQSMLWRSGEILNLNTCFSATIDGDLITDHPITTFRAGEQHKIPLMIGTNIDETWFAKTFYLRAKTRARRAQTMLEGYDPVGAATILRFYNNAASRKDYTNLLADSVFWAPSVIAASAHSLSAPTWMYRFDFAPAALRWLGIGASHTAELSPVFGDLAGSKAATLNKLGSWEELHVLRDQMQSYWANFIHTGNPNTNGNSAAGATAETTNTSTSAVNSETFWPQYRMPSDTLPGRATKVFDTTAYVVYDPNAARRVAWENYNMVEWVKAAEWVRVD